MILCLVGEHDLFTSNRRMSEILSLRVPVGTAERLKLLACERSLRTLRPITWPNIVRQHIEKMLVSRTQGQTLFPDE
jgi:hypothetical protein